VLPNARTRRRILLRRFGGGLITSLESAIYAVTKHASLALAEWISMTYGDRGIRVSAVPQGVRTNMLMQTRQHSGEVRCRWSRWRTR